MINLRFSGKIQFGIRQKILLILLIILLVSLTTSGLILFKQAESNSLLEINTRGNELSRIIAKALTSSVVSYDYHTIEQLLNEVTSSDEVSYAKALSIKGNVMAETGEYKNAPEMEVIFTQDIRLDDTSVGTLILGITTENTRHRLQQQKNTLLKQEAAIILFIALVEFIALSYIIIRPLNIISRSLDKHIDDAGQIVGQIPLTSRDEFGQLSILFNNLNSQLHEANNKLKEKVNLSDQALIETNQQLTRQTEELHKINEKFKNLSITDPLTGLYNRRHFEELMLEEIELSKCQKNHNSLLIIDIDHFKQINDNYGHPGGDQILKDIAKLFITQLRDTDIICRIGGEEFAVFCKCADRENAIKISEQLRKAVEDFTFIIDNREIKLTISIGIETTSELNINSPVNILSHLIYQHADQSVYYSKQNGRNRTTHFYNINTGPKDKPRIFPDE